MASSTNPFDTSTPPESSSPIEKREEGTSSIKNSQQLQDTVNWLLKEGLVLTCLELHTELLENGIQVPQLKDYFSNPGNFETAIPQPIKSDLLRTPSMSTFDSLELGRVSDDGRDNEERVAVLEFELRKAYDTIKSLRGSLTKASDTTRVGGAGGEKDNKISDSNEPIKPHEKKALNYLVHEYLNETSNKLTAITLSDENSDQNFEDWDDVGLNIPKPPSLLKQFRHYDSFALAGQDQVIKMTQLEKEIQVLNAQLIAMKRENESLTIKLKKLSLSSLDDDIVSPRRGRGQSETTFRKAFTPDLSHASGHTHKRNSSDTFVDVSSSLTFEVSPVRNVSNYKDTTKYSPTSSDSQLDTPTLTRAAPATPTLIRGPLPIETTPTNTTEEQSPPATEQTQDTTDSLQETSVVSSEVGVVMPEVGVVISSGDEITKRQMSLLFRQELLECVSLKGGETDILLEINNLSNPNHDIIDLLSRRLPEVIQNTLLPKREGLIPILLCAINNQTNSRQRDKLLNMLFNLIKRPTKEQRQMIIAGCVAFAQLNGSSKVEAELLPQVWEQINDKYYERRLLVAESCGVLAPHIPAELRSSLVLSIIQQMLQEDKGESVREAVVKSLAVLVAFIDDEDKFKLCWELLLRSLNDSSQIVSTASLTVLLPALAAWSYELNRLENDIILYFLSQLYTCIKQVSRSEGESGATERCQQYLVTLTHIVPWHFASVLLTGPYAEGIETSEVEPQEVQFPHPFSRLLDIHVIIGDSKRLYKLVHEMERAVSDDDRFNSWNKLDWFQEECLRSLLKTTETLGFSQPEILHSLSVLLSAYCSYFGRVFTHKVIKPFFQSSLKANQLSQGQSCLTSALLPLYLAGVLTSFNEDREEFTSYFQDIIVNISLSYSSIESLKASIIELKRDRKLHPLLLQLLDNLAGHSSMQVRRYTAVLLGLMISDVDEKYVSLYVLKTLLRLSVDSESNVKTETIDSLGTIMETISKRDVLSQVHKQFDQFIQDKDTINDFLLYSTILKTLARISPNADPVFRDEFIIPFLMEASEHNNTAPNITQRRDISTILIEAYKGLSGSFISVDLLTSYMLPGLEFLLNDCKVVDPDNKSLVEQLINDTQAKITTHQKNLSDLGNKESSNKFLGRIKDIDFTPPKMSFSFKKKNVDK